MLRFTKGDRSHELQVASRVRRSNGKGNTNVDHWITLENSTILEVTSFCYLGDMFGGEGGAERTVKMRVAAAGGEVERNIGTVGHERHTPQEKSCSI